MILSAGGISGTFNPQIVTNLPVNYAAGLSYDASHAYLNLALNFKQSQAGALNSNQQNVANALVNSFNTSGGIPVAFGTSAPKGLTQMSGELSAGTNQTTFNAMNLFLGTQLDPFVDNRDGTGSVPPGALQFAEERAEENRLSSNPKDAFAQALSPASPSIDPFAKRWAIWAAGFGGAQTTEGNVATGSNTASSRIYGTAIGVDYRISPNTVAGFALAGGGTNSSIANALGTARSDLFQAGGFLRHAVGPAYISGALGYGWQDVTASRTVTIAGIDQLQARFNSNAFSGRVEGGYRFALPWMGMTPYSAGQFTAFNLPSYSEQALVGSNRFALNFLAQDAVASRSELGLRADKSYVVNDAILSLRSRLAWAHNFDGNPSVAATFQALPGASFVVNGAAQAHESALTTASAEMKFITGISLAATFEGEFSNVTNSYAGKGVARYQW